MRNRAKCRLCNSIIESFHPTDFVECKCGEIAVDAGEALRCAAKDWANFIRVDDAGKEIPIVAKEEKEDVKPLDIQNPLSKEELVSMLSEMAKSYENLPQHAMMQPVTNYDLASSLLLVSEVFKSFLR